jgi:PAS domain S-box-containing protein
MIDRRDGENRLAMDTAVWPYGRGEMAERIRTFNWASTPLGPILSWPQSLKTAVEVMLGSGFPASMQWGKEAILLYNDANARILGSLHPAALGRPIFEALPARRPTWEPVLRRVLTGESVVFGERRRLINEDGVEGEIWVDRAASPIRDETGAVVGLWEVFIDITAYAERQRKLAEDALRETEAREAFLLRLSDELRALAEPFAIQATVCRMVGEHLRVNRCSYGEICGEEVVLRSTWGGDDAPLTERFALAEHGTALVEEFLAGRAIVVEDIENNPRLSEVGRDRLRAARIAAFIGVSPLKEARAGAVFGVQSAVPRAWTASEVELVRDVAERTCAAVKRARAEAALRDSEERFRQFAEASTDVIWILNAQSQQLEYRNPIFERVFGETRDNAPGDDDLKAWLDLVVPEDRERALASIVRVLSGERVTSEYRFKRPCDGEIRWLRSAGFPLLDGEGRVQRIGGICRDITGEKATAERMEVMVAELQHRTRNLMAVVQSIIAQTLAASEDLGAFKTRIDERLIALSRVQSLLSRSEQEPITIGALVRLELDALGRDVLLDRVEVSGPAVRIRNSTVQVLALGLHELATNARKYGALSTDQGRLRIGWHVEQIDGEPCLLLSWIEERAVGVAVKRDRRGYGRELIERALPYSLNAETRYELDDAGLRCTIALPLAREGPKERGT